MPDSTRARRRPRVLDNPWWIPPFLGSVPKELDPALVNLLGLVAFGMLFEQYELSVLTLALKQIGDGLAISEAALGWHLAIIRLGAVPAFFIVPFADRLGRRRLFLVALVGLSVGAFLTAFVQTAAQFVAIQMATRAFMITCGTLGFVIVTEEFPAAVRGWGIGMLGALAAFGHGLGAGLFAMVNALPGGWRALYGVGLLPLLLLPMFRRGIRETNRFTTQVRASTGQRGPLRPIFELLTTHPGRVAVIGGAGMLFAVGEVAVFQFAAYYLQAYRQWLPWQASALVVGGGALGIVGNVVAGRLGDRIGRRVVGAVFVLAFPALAWAFYTGPDWSLPLAWAGFVFSNTGAGVIMRALSTELFPTAHRGTSAGWFAMLQSLGWAAGLILVSEGLDTGTIDLPATITMVSLIVLPSAVLLLFVPETHRRELEQIA